MFIPSSFMIYMKHNLYWKRTIYARTRLSAMNLVNQYYFLGLYIDRETDKQTEADREIDRQT